MLFQAASAPVRDAGFTLVEVLVTLAISSMVMAMVMSTMITVSGSLNQVERGALAADEAGLLNEYLAGMLMSVGGGAVRPWAAVWVENNVMPDHSDRLIAAELADNSLQCTIDQYSGNQLTINATGGCCLTEAWRRRQLVLMTGEGDERMHWVSRFVKELDLTRCRATLEDGQGTVMDNPPSTADDWIEGMAAVVHMRVIWLDASTLTLNVAQDYNLDGVIETRVVADRVIDLQLALGYDASPWDWKVSDTNDTADEWLYNASGDTFGLDDGQGLAQARRDELRLVRFGIMVGCPVATFRGRQPVRLLDGPARSKSGWIVRSVMGVVGLRNHDVMR